AGRIVVRTRHAIGTHGRICLFITQSPIHKRCGYNLLKSLMIQIRPPWPRWLILSHLCTCATAAGVRISTKLAVTLAVTSALILCAYGARQLLQEKGDLQASAEHELRLLGVAIQVAVENALRDQQAADV